VPASTRYLDGPLGLALKLYRCLDRASYSRVILDYQDMATLYRTMQ